MQRRFLSLSLCALMALSLAAQDVDKATVTAEAEKAQAAGENMNGMNKVREKNPLSYALF